jgi:hypothetical protein
MRTNFNRRWNCAGPHDADVSILQRIFIEKFDEGKMLLKIENDVPGFSESRLSFKFEKHVSKTAHWKEVL